MGFSKPVKAIKEEIRKKIKNIKILSNSGFGNYSAINRGTN